jgi:hypothetical protein
MQNTLSDAARAVWNRNHGLLAEFALNLALSQLRYDSYFASVGFPSICARCEPCVPVGDRATDSIRAPTAV